MPLEEVTGQITRRFVTSERMMLAQIFLQKGSIVPYHSHENEQITYVIEGALLFWMGRKGEAEEVVVRAGEVLVIPSGLPHEVKALEDTIDIDVFSPPRRDWIEGTDSYFRAEPQVVETDSGAG